MEFNNDPSAPYELLWLRPGVDSGGDWGARHPDCIRVPAKPAFVLRPADSPHPVADADLLRREPLERHNSGVVEFHTNDVLVGFDEPKDLAEVLVLLGDERYGGVRPLEAGADEDWTWIVSVPPRLDAAEEARRIAAAHPGVSAELDRVVVGIRRGSLRHF